MDGINVEKANLLLFLLRTCFNCLYRVNSKGQFNTPFGKKTYRKINKAEIQQMSNLLQSVKFYSVDFEELNFLIKPNTFFYLDPPYLPERNSIKQIKYTPDKFEEDEQIRLFHFVERINTVGAKFLLSNSNTDDQYFQQLYHNYTIEKVETKRLIASRADAREVLTELLIENY